MTENTTQPSSPAGTLQFDKAEVVGTPAATTCVGCKRPIASTYYQINQRVICPTCKEGALLALSKRSDLSRFLPALMWGLLGAVAGAALWMTVTLVTGYELGLIAVVVGVIVGAAVKKGARGQGGWVFQTMAVVLAYLAIVFTYVPQIHKSIVENDREAATSATEHAGAKHAPATNADPSAATESNRPGAEKSHLPAFIRWPIYFVVLYGLACALPFMSLPQNLIGLLIIGFALFNAWKLNKRVPVAVTGPFEFAPPAPVRV